MPYVSQILIYPIKSLDGIAVTKAKVLPSGALEHDRQFAIFDEQGRFVNGKRNAKVHLLRTSFNLEAQTVSLQAHQTEEAAVFHLQQERMELEAWLSDYFGKKVQLQENLVQGFPDDTNANGPTVISTATIATVADWFTGISSEQMRQRLRANVEIADVPPFWEDGLFGETGNIVEFQIGSIRFEGINPCARCIVPTRDALTGQAYPNFQKIFIAQRQASLPSWVSSSRFNHFYRLSVNTCIPDSEAGTILQVGDEVTFPYSGKTH
ncbi:MAG: MOSC domain-containing protein [Symploca sp. SIO2G7]|nr:MOSC domain-containing protein [Symploca sp. SIO2G7]